MEKKPTLKKETLNFDKKPTQQNNKELLYTRKHGYEKEQIEDWTKIENFPNDVIMIHGTLPSNYVEKIGGGTSVTGGTWKNKIDHAIKKAPHISCSTIEVGKFIDNHLFSTIGLIVSKGKITDVGSTLVNLSGERYVVNRLNDNGEIMKPNESVVAKSSFIAARNKKNTHNEYAVKNPHFSHIYYNFSDIQNVNFSDFWESTVQYNIPRVIFCKGRIYEPQIIERDVVIKKYDGKKSVMFMNDIFGKEIIDDNEVLFDKTKYILNWDSNPGNIYPYPDGREEDVTVKIVTLGKDITDDIKE